MKKDERQPSSDDNDTFFLFFFFKKTLRHILNRILKSTMSIHPKTPIVDDSYCQVCSSTSSITGNKHLSCFLCEHCHLSMCYDCFEQHTTKLIDEHLQLEKRFLQLTNLFHNKKQLFLTFKEHCIRSVNSTYDEIINDLETLRNESINYVKQQFNDTEVS